MTVTSLAFPEFGDSIDSFSKVMLGIHRSTEATTTYLTIVKPPFVKPPPINPFVVEDFNKQNYIISWSPESVF